MKRLTLHIGLILATATVLLLAGCATDQDTDIPWNTPQPWEGSPTIPGMPGYR